MSEDRVLCEECEQQTDPDHLQKCEGGCRRYLCQSCLYEWMDRVMCDGCLTTLTDKIDDNKEQPKDE